MHHHVQALTVLEATHPENTQSIKHTAIRRNVYKDSNNNVQQITKESLNVVTPKEKSEEESEYTLLGFIKFKSPIKWINSISIILIHLIFVYGFFTYPTKAALLTTLWGEFRFLHQLKFLHVL